MEKDNRKRVSPFSHRNYFHPITLFRPHQKEAHSARGKKTSFLSHHHRHKLRASWRHFRFSLFPNNNNNKKALEYRYTNIAPLSFGKFFFCSVLFTSFQYSFLLYQSGIRPPTTCRLCPLCGRENYVSPFLKEEKCVKKKEAHPSITTGTTGNSLTNGEKNLLKS